MIVSTEKLASAGIFYGREADKPTHSRRQRQRSFDFLLDSGRNCPCGVKGAQPGER